MNNNIKKRINQIEIENYIWLIYFIIIGLSYYGNYLEKDYFLTNNKTSKDKYRKINAIVFIILIFIYGYFENNALIDFYNKNKSRKQIKYDSLSLLATTLVLISGFIFLYIILDDTNLDTEIAFN